MLAFKTPDRHIDGRQSRKIWHAEAVIGGSHLPAAVTARPRTVMTERTRDGSIGKTRHFRFLAGTVTASAAGAGWAGESSGGFFAP